MSDLSSHRQSSEERDPEPMQCCPVLTALGVDMDVPSSCLSPLALNAVAVPVYVKNAAGVFRLCNQAFCDFIELPMELVIDKRSEDLFPENLALAFDRRTAQLFEDGLPQEEELIVPTSSGRARRIRLHRSPVNVGGRVVGVVGTVLDQTEEIEAALALERSKARYRGLFDSSIDALFLMRDGVFIDCNPAALEMFGCDRSEIIGHSPIEFSPPFQYDGRSSEEKAKEMVCNALEGERQFFDWRHRRKNGSLFDAEVCLNAVHIEGKASIRAQVRDVTKRRRAQLALRASENLNRGIVEHSPVGIIYVDADGVIRHENPAMKRILGVPPGTESPALNTQIRDLPGVASSGKIEFLDAVLAGEPAHGIDLRFTSIFGVESHLELHLAPHIDEQGEVVGAVLMCHDVTDLRELEDQLRHTQKMDAIGTLAGGIAHDFNNLLTGIVGHADLAQQHLERPDKLRVNVQEILASTERAAALTRRLLAFSRKQLWDLRVVSLNEIINELERMLRRVIGEPVQMLLALAPELWNVRVDSSQIEQAIVNLAINARDAMQEGGTLRLSTRNVRTTEGLHSDYGQVPQGDYVLLTVEDDGQGMDEEVRRRAFDPFFTTKEVGRGTGLGLSMVYGTVRQSDGLVNIESSPNAGTQVRIYLPRSTETAESITPVAIERSLAMGTGSILVVEDEPVVRQLAERVLRHCGYEVYAVANAEEALAMVSQFGAPVDLIVSDVVMPGLSGPRMIEEVRRHWPDVRVLFTSGYTQDAWDVASVSAEQEALLVKPFTAEDLSQAVAGAIARGRV